MPKNKTVLKHILLGLIPFTESGLKLAFNPRSFFWEMEKITSANRNTIQSTFSRARKQGLISKDLDNPILTEKGLRKVMPYIPKEIKNGYLMVIFDIPEEIARARQQFRQYLKTMDFEMRQKSVWITKRDYREELKKIIQAHDLGEFIQIYECIKLFP